jgi:hypothetical protein
MILSRDVAITGGGIGDGQVGQFGVAVSIGRACLRRWSSITMRRASVVSHGMRDGSLRSSRPASRQARTIVSWTTSSACSRFPAVSRITNVINGARYC